MEDEHVLGGDIKLSGFKDVERDELLIVKKLVGSYVRRFSDWFEDYRGLEIHLKKIHKTPKSQKYELNSKLFVNNEVVTSSETDRNLFVAVDGLLKKLERMVKKA